MLSKRLLTNSFRWLLLPLLLLLLLPGASPLQAQPPAAPATLRINRLPAAGLLLEKGWRYQVGDNPAWARPDFDDSGWDTLNPTRPLRQLPPRLCAGISWLRLRFRLGDSLRQRQLLLKASSRVGAWELYLNGKLVQRDGVLHPDPGQVRPNGDFSELVEVPGAGGPAELVVAIRFAYWRPLLLPRTKLNVLQTLRLLGRSQVRQQETVWAAEGLAFYTIGAIMGLLMLLHLAFFRYNPAQRANRYFAFYAGGLSLGAIGFYYSSRLPFPTLGLELSFLGVAFTLVGLSGLWTVRALYDLFGFRPGRLYRGLWVICPGLIALSVLLLQSGEGFLAFLAAVLLATAEQLRLVFQALRERRRGARVIGVGFGVALLTLLLIVGLLLAGTPAPPWLNMLSFVLIFLPPALGISLFLAREFALDSQLLQVKLGEVERLSAQTLAQEQDKQALLAQQNETLETQVAQRTEQLQRSLTELQTTQTQLIQKEKMASLGELTAGIAHEIQNPLNFVNNFAEVSVELVGELKEAQAAGDPVEVSALADDLAQNLGKISQHGQRAASIVRGMLEHSRQSTGERAPTDINALCDEYLRLAYQGLRAKDKTFNCALKTDFWPQLPPVEAAGADLGRVLLNLFNNAFYAVRQHQLSGPDAGSGYVPQVEVSTRQAGSRVEIRVQDNGTGMPAEVQQKIFQPFFTTKPTGEGTGLGLSLSYDIISKGHGGTLTVESTPGAGTTFVILLPT